MNKYIRFSALPLMFLALILLAAETMNAQVINDGCMRIRPYVSDTWLQEFEDPFQADEVALFWYAADNANLDGQGWRTNGFMYFQGTNWIGWRTIFDGGDDQAASFPTVNLFDQTYGTINTNVTVSTPQYLQIRGSYTGDDCGAPSGCETCLFDDDDYCYDDVLTTTFNYRFAPPNQNTTTTDVFTTNHGAAPPVLGGGSNFGARISVDWSSPIPTAITASPGTSTCSGGSITLTATGTLFGGSYTWETSSGTTVGNGATITVSPLVNTTYRVFCTNGGIKSLCFKDIDILVSSNPVTNNTITGTGNLGPFCSIGDPGLITGNTPSVAFPTWTYQWETSINGGASWSIASGPFSSAVLPYQFDPVATSQTVLVRRVVRTGGCDNSSNVLTYSIEQPITNNVISSDQTLCGTSTPIGLTGTLPTGGNGIYGYQWQSATSIGGPYNNITGANSQNYSPGVLVNTTFFRRVITGGACAASNSNVVTITIEPVIAGNTIGAPQSFCGSGDPVTLTGTGSLSGGNGTYTYQWQESSDGGNTWAAAASTSATFNPPVLTQTTTYRRGVYSGTCFSNSPNVTITIYPVITNNSISTDQASCGAFTPATLLGTTPGGGTGSYTYTWEQNVNGGGWTIIGGANSANYSPGLVSATTQYRRTVNSLPCSDVSNVVTVTITPVITVNTIGTSQTFCVSGDPGTLTGPVPTGGNGSFTYQWQSSPDGFTWTNISGATNQGYAPGNITATTYFLRNAFSGSCSLSSNPVTITIVPAISGNSISANQSFCGSGDPTLLIGSTPSGGTGTYTFQWLVSTDNFTFTPIGGAVNQNYDPGNLTVTTYFRRDVTSSACSSSSNVVTITVVPVLTNNTIDNYQRFCGQGDPVTINGSAPAGGTGTYTYQWETSPNGITWTPIGGAVAASYDPPFTTTTVYYQRLVLSSVCSSTSNTSQVLILQLPQVTQVTTSNVLCNGGNTGSILVSGTSTNGSAFYSINGGQSYQSSGSFSSLTAGGYDVFITDDSACVNSYSGNSVVVTEPAMLDHTTVAQNASCDNVFDGSITINATGGTQPYSYSLNGGPSQPGNVFNGLADGTYSILVSDANSCTDTSTVVIDTAYAVYASLVSQTPVSCFGGVDGTVTVQLTGGLPPYSYSINGIQFVPSPTFTGLASGNYVVTLRDSKGCTDFVSVTVTQPNQLQAQIDSTSNIGCNGASTGAIYISVSGGNAPYDFLWSNGAITDDITNLVAGTYNVAITDAKGCTTSVGATISQPLPLFLNIASFHNLSCYNDSSGSIDITANGGVPPYSFAWSNGATTEDVFGLLPNTYSVTVTDANGCNQTISQVITEPTQLSSTISSTQVLCAGAASGAVDLTVNGGTLPYNFVWSNGATSEDLNNVAGGLYTVIVYDANGCSITNSTTVTEPAPIAISLVKTDVLCNGNSTGAIDITVNGGTPVITYAWSNNATTEDLTSIPAGTYSVTITDGNACSASASATITQPAGLVFNATPVNVSCAGGANGSVDITVQGGVFPYNFAWSNGATTEDINGLSGGNYTVSVTDANGCSLSASFTISEPTPITAILTGTNVSCFGAANGSIDLTASGGTAPYTYLWNTFQTVEDLSGISGGTYFVIITDANGCTLNDSIVITEAPALVLNLAVTNVVCNGASTGAIDLTVGGGAPAYTYLWSNSATSEDLTGLAVGNYSVIVTDAASCTASASATITQPTGLVFNATPVNVSCAGGANGSVDITVQGGVFPYNFAWSNGATTEDINGLSGGNYTVSVTDANVCSLSASFTISEPTPITAILTGTNVSCFGAANGSIDLTASGGTAPYTYLWNTFQTVEDLSGISGGTYFVIITDANGCTLHDSIVITEAPALVLNLAVTNVICNGANTGAIDLTVGGGAPAYTYLWSNNATSEDLSGLAAGNYSVVVTDAASCTASASAVVSQSNPIVINSSTQNVSCFGGNDGSVDISVQGGTFPYTYSWSNSATSEDIRNVLTGTYSVTVSDAAGCSVTASYILTGPTGMVSSVSGTNVTCNGAKNGAADLTVSGGVAPYTFLWSTFQGTEDISGLNGGLYYVIITDANGCEKKDSILIAEPAAIALTLNVTNITCFNANNGAINLVVAGGTPGFTYAWSNNATTEDLGNLPGGQYVVSVTDANGCTASGSATIVNPSAIFANFINKNPLCFGDTSGRIDLIPSGGTPPFTYLWSNGRTTEDLINVPAGSYSVTITDSRNCSYVDSTTITEPGQIFTSGVVKNVTCAGLGDGFVDITAYAGTLPYSYLWSTNQTTEDIFSLPGGDYYLTVTDANGCLGVSLYTVREPLPLGISLVKTDVLCNGAATGTLAVIPSEGTRPYYYLWSNFVTDSALVGVRAGHYVIQLTDSSGCFIYDSVDVLEPAKLALTGTTTDAVCFGSATGVIDITVTGGVTAYNYGWSNGANSPDLNGVTAGPYTVTVTDANNCSLSAAFTLGQGSKINPNLASLDPICHGGNTGSASALTNGGAQPYTYAWSNGKTTIAVGNLVAGTYTLTVTDALNCTASDSVVISDPARIVVTAAANGAKCFNTATGNVSTVVTGGFAPYTYLLNAVAQTTDTFTGLLPGDYVLLVTDVNGCQGSASFSVSSPKEISVDLNVTEQVILTGMQTQLVATANSISPILNYYWTPERDTNNRVIFDFSSCGDPLNCSNPLVAPRTTTTFTVTVMNSDSCYASDTVTVQVLNQPSAFLPTAFTPNGDGLNDRFEFDILGAENIEVAIFDRWGQRIYYNPTQVNGINKNSGWDGTINGKLAPLDTYIYQMTVRYFDDVSKDFTGTVTLMK